MARKGMQRAANRRAARTTHVETMQEENPPAATVVRSDRQAAQSVWRGGVPEANSPKAARQRNRPASCAQRTASAAPPAPPRPLPKNHAFYRRRGALWTDLYHTPAERLQFTAWRPDLDEAAAAVVEKRRCADQQRASDALAVRSDTRREVLSQFQERRRKNYEKDPYPQIPRPKQQRPSRNRRSRRRLPVQIKDHAYYRRTGALWSDLTQTPEERIELVATKKVIEGDLWAAAKIEERRLRELEVAELERSRSLKRVAEIRDEFRSRVEINRKRDEDFLAGADIVSPQMRRASMEREQVAAAWEGEQPSVVGMLAQRDTEGTKRAAARLSATMAEGRQGRPESAPIRRRHKAVARHPAHPERPHEAPRPQLLRPATSPAVRTDMRAPARIEELARPKRPSSKEAVLAKFAFNSGDYAGLLHTDESLRPDLARIYHSRQRPQTSTHRQQLTKAPTDNDDNAVLPRAARPVSAPSRASPEHGGHELSCTEEGLTWSEFRQEATVRGLLGEVALRGEVCSPRSWSREEEEEEEEVRQVYSDLDDFDAQLRRLESEEARARPVPFYLSGAGKK